MRLEERVVLQEAGTALRTTVVSEDWPPKDILEEEENEIHLARDRYASIASTENVSAL